MVGGVYVVGRMTSACQVNWSRESFAFVVCSWAKDEGPTMGYLQRGSEHSLASWVCLYLATQYGGIQSFEPDCGHNVMRGHSICMKVHAYASEHLTHCSLGCI